jgi:hypothetical protein
MRDETRNPANAGLKVESNVVREAYLVKRGGAYPPLAEVSRSDGGGEKDNGLKVEG